MPPKSKADTERVTNPLSLPDRPYVGETVHVHWRGGCHAAMIVEFWEDDNTAAITRFDKGGQFADPRAERGEVGQDRKWHRLNECPSVG